MKRLNIDVDSGLLAATGGCGRGLSAAGPTLMILADLIDEVASYSHSAPPIRLPAEESPRDG